MVAFIYLFNSLWLFHNWWEKANYMPLLKFKFYISLSSWKSELTFPSDGNNLAESFMEDIYLSSSFSLGFCDFDRIERVVAAIVDIIGGFIAFDNYLVACKSLHHILLFPALFLTPLPLPGSSLSSLCIHPKTWSVNDPFDFAIDEETSWLCSVIPVD